MCSSCRQKIAELEQERDELRQVNRYLAYELAEATDKLKAISKLMERETS